MQARVRVCVRVFVCDGGMIISIEFIKSHYGTMKLTISISQCIHGEPGMQLLLSSSCASSSFNGVDVSPSRCISFRSC